VVMVKGMSNAGGGGSDNRVYLSKGDRMANSDSVSHSMEV
jgi:hypothetical protein